MEPISSEYVLANLADGITIQDRDFNIIYQNDAMIQAFGCHVGEKCYAIYERRDRTCEGCPLQKVFATGKPHVVVRTAFAADGTTSYWENSCFALFDDEGHITAGVEVCRNITDRVSLEEQVKDRNIELGQLNRQLNERTAELQLALVEREQAEVELRKAQQKLVETAHRAGMADVATDVLHNVGNVLNSINVTTTRLVEMLVSSKVASLSRVVGVLGAHADDLGAFLSEDDRGRQIPAFLVKLSQRLGEEQALFAEMLDGLAKNVQHIKDTITMQQSYAKVSGLEEQTSMAELIEDAIQINSAGLERHEVRLVREYQGLPVVQVNKQKVLQILVNLISNAQYALSNSEQQDKVLTIRLGRRGQERLCIEVIDNGIGIAAENINRIFRHGFTTKKNGHGFGLHSGALAAKEMGGKLEVHSNGVGQGAAFALVLPLNISDAIEDPAATKERASATAL